MAEPGGRHDPLGRLLPLPEAARTTSLRLEMREWLATHLTGRFSALVGRGGLWDEAVFDLAVEWERLLAANGWACLSWPVEYGGRGATPAEVYAVRDEYFTAGGPERLNFMAEDQVGPTIMKHGTEEQRERFLGPMLRCEEMWCQGYSEPDAGSDLANIRTRARLENDRWVIDGHKIWTSMAAGAQWCFALCRTDPGSTRRSGLSYLLIPMDQPGISVRPIRQMTGSAEFSEVFLDGAFTDADNVVGHVGAGWEVAMSTLGFERDWFMSRYFRFARDYTRVARAIRQQASPGSAELTAVVDSFVGLAAFRAAGLESLESYGSGDYDGVLSALTKLFSSEWHRDLGALGFATLGREGARQHPDESAAADLQRIYLYSRAETIFAGTSEIQRSILARRFLGLADSGRPNGRGTT